MLIRITMSWNYYFQRHIYWHIGEFNRHLRLSILVMKEYLFDFFFGIVFKITRFLRCFFFSFVLNSTVFLWVVHYRTGSLGFWEWARQCRNGCASDEENLEYFDRWASKSTKLHFCSQRKSSMDYKLSRFSAAMNLARENELLATQWKSLTSG